MTFGESGIPPPKRERVIASFLPKLTLWSAKIMVQVFTQKTLGVRDLLGCWALAHGTRIMLG